MNKCRSFAPSFDAGCTLLVLGSMPGAESLKQGEYYAFRHNAFWRIMGELYRFDCAAPYPERLAALRQNHVALWDVLESCDRSGSLDSDIARPVPNDIPALLRKCPKISRIFCNGGASHRYLKRFFPELAATAVRLPSSSPAAAQLNYSAKLTLWRQALTAE